MLPVKYDLNSSTHPPIWKKKTKKPYILEDCCVHMFYFVFIVAFKLATATHQAEMSSVKLATWIPCSQDITFPISKILSGYF